MITHAICNECKGACCEESRLEFPVDPRTTEATMQRALAEEVGLSREEATALEVRVDEHGRTVVRTRCHRRGHCDQANRPAACLLFPIHYLNADHSDAERDEVREFCPLFRMLEEGR